MNYNDWKAVVIDNTKTWTEWKAEQAKKVVTTAASSGILQTITFVPAKTITEANEYAMNTLGIPKASYKGYDVETANAWNEGLTDSFNRFPELKKNFGFVGEAHERRTMIRDATRQWAEMKLKGLQPNRDIEERRKDAWKQADDWFHKKFPTIKKILHNSSAPLPGLFPAYCVIPPQRSTTTFRRHSLSAEKIPRQWHELIYAVLP